MGSISNKNNYLTKWWLFQFANFYSHIVFGLYSHRLHNSLLTKLAFSFSIQYSVLALTTVLPKQRWIFSLYWARFPISCTQTYLVYVYVTSASVLLLVSKYLTGMLFSKRPFTILREFAKGQMGVYYAIFVRSFARMCVLMCVWLNVFKQFKRAWRMIVFKTCKGYPNSTFFVNFLILMYICLGARNVVRRNY